MNEWNKKLIVVFFQIVAIAVVVAMPSFAVDNFSDFSLSVDGSGTVVASYDDGTKTITISGEGTIDRDKWIKLAQEFKGDAFTGSLGWHHEESDPINMVFTGSGTNKILLPARSSFFFSSLRGRIDFNNNISTENVTNMYSMFSNATAFNGSLGDKFDTSNVTNMEHMFANARSFNQPLGNHFNTINVKKMRKMFSMASSFNQPLGANFNTKNVEDMQSMFREATAFNGSLGAKFDTSKVKNMTCMFNNAVSFNQPLGDKFDTSNVTNMSHMFSIARAFNQFLGDKFNTSNVKKMDGMFYAANAFNNGEEAGLSGRPLSLDTSSVTQMSRMFNGATSFNQPLGSNFDTSGVTNMDYMFCEATLFNQPLGDKFTLESTNSLKYMFNNASSFNQPFGNNFDTSHITNMSGMFFGAGSFNNGEDAGLSGNPLNFDTSSVTNMASMFNGAVAFNQSLGDSFETTNVTNMSYMFHRAIKFNQPLGDKFNTGNVTTMSRMFSMTNAFNQPLGDEFDTSSVTDMSYMFYRASAFNESLGDKFNTISVTNMDTMFNGALVFNQPLGDKFNTENVTIMKNMFKDARAFNQPLPSNFNTQNVGNMASMFFGASSFNNGDEEGISGSPLNLDTSSVTDMSSMFNGAISFNQRLGDKFDTSSVTDMSYMFHRALKFNSSLGGKFDTSKVTNMYRMFALARLFNQPLGDKFDTSSASNMAAMFNDAKSFNQPFGDKFATSQATNMSEMFKGASGLKKIYLRRSNSVDVLPTIVNFISGVDLDSLGFRSLPAFTWTLPQGKHYWMRTNDGAPEKVTGNSIDFLANTKYEVDVKEIPSISVTGLSVGYTGSIISADELITRAVNSANEAVEGTWQIEYIGDKAVQLGTYPAICTFTPNDKDTYAVTTEDITVTVVKGSPAFTLPTNLSATYGDVLSSIGLPAYFNGTLAFENTNALVGNAGTNPVAVTFTPNDTAHYNLVTTTVDVTVAKKDLGLVGLVVADKVYDGNNIAGLTYTSVSGRVAGETSAEVDIDLTATFDDENVGVNKPVSITATLTGTKAENYAVIIPTAMTASIGKGDFDITPPSGLKGWLGETLSEVRIPVVDGGIWEFDAGNTVLDRTGKHRYNITFTPSSSNFKVINTSTELEVLEYKESKPLVDEEESKEDVIDEGKTVPASSNGDLPFDDVEKTDWFYDSVKSTYKSRVLKGTSENTFSPALNVTRGMVITSIYQMSGEKVEGVEHSFIDVRKNSYYEKAISWGEKKHVVKGYGLDFKPDKDILRQEMVAMLYRYRNCDCYDKLASDPKAVDKFGDAENVSTYAREAMDWAVSTGLIVGRSGYVLAPREVLTRAELATILERFSRLAK